MPHAKTAHHAAAAETPPPQSFLRRYAHADPASTPSPPSRHCSATPSLHRSPPCPAPATSSPNNHLLKPGHTPPHAHGMYPDTPPPARRASASPPAPPPAPACRPVKTPPPPYSQSIS